MSLAARARRVRSARRRQPVLSRIRSRWERTVPIADVYPLARVREACTELGRRHTHGKIVLRP
jgi:hypothetical protein